MEFLPQLFLAINYSIYLSTVLKLSPSPSTLQLCFGSTCPALILVVIVIVPLFLTRLNNVSYVSIVHLYKMVYTDVVLSV